MTTSLPLGTLVDKGQALMAGGFVDQQSVVQLGARLTREGGSDVAVPLR